MFWLCCSLLCLIGCGQRTPASATPTEKQLEAQPPTNTDATAERQLSPAQDNAPVQLPKVHQADKQQPDVQPPWEPQGQWTTKRMIVLAETGPCLIDLSVSLEGKSLEQAAQELLGKIADELFADLKRPAKWEELLELPLVRSGWLGNLIADGEQRGQLISLYDTERDGIVSEDELPAFLSRGLSRVGPMQLNDVGHAPDSDTSLSPWGKGDLNQDFSLDAEELTALKSNLQKEDVNGDGVITRRELSGTTMPMASMGGRNRSSRLKTNTLMVAQPSDSTSVSNLSATKSNSSPQAMATSPPTTSLDSKSERKLATDLLRHYTYLSELPREQWPDWNDQLWDSMDANQDQNLDASELQKLVTIPSAAQVYVSLTQGLALQGPELQGPAPQGQAPPGQTLWGKTPQVNVKLTEPASSWRANDGGGQLVCGSCSLRIELTDAFNEPGKTQLRQQLNLALKNAQLQAFFVNRMQLDENAFKLIDQDNDQTLSDMEFERVWRWVLGRQSARIAGRWMLNGQPWFQLADNNADSRLSGLELQDLGQSLAGLDRNGDRQLTPNELPLVVTLAIARSDSRLDNQLPQSGQPNSVQAVDLDWFSAMDTNRDGSVSSGEFLGEVADFSRLDANQDGFIARGEVYIPKASN